MGASREAAWGWHLVTLSLQSKAFPENFSSPHEPASARKLSFISSPKCFLYCILFWSCTLFEVTIATCHQLVSHSNAGIEVASS